MRTAVSLILFSVSALAQAEECPDSPAIIAHECLSRQVKSAEAVLAKKYDEALTSIPINEPGKVQKAKDLLTESQRTWLAHREASCTYRGFVEGGAAPYKGVRQVQCLVQMTEARAAELQAMLKHYE